MAELRIEPAKTALVVIDLQRGIVAMPSEPRSSTEVVSRAAQLAAALRKAGVKGKAVVTVRITPQGTVRDPVVESASDPAFGEAALAAVRQWRFIPRVEDGRAVEARVNMPFVFAPP